MRLLACSAAVVCVAYLSSFAHQPSSGPQYVVSVTQPGIIRFEGSYAQALAYTSSHQGEWTIYKLHGRRCNPSKKLCLA